jgi:hypothetical protein
MTYGGNKAGVNEGAAMNTAAGGAGRAQAGPLADPCRYVVVVPSRSNTPVNRRFDVASLDEGRARLETEGRGWVYDRETGARLHLEDLRQAINDGEMTTLSWPMESKDDPCPVELGAIFDLRSCTIEITRIERTRGKGRRTWIALFTRYPHHADRPLLIAASGDGYTSDSKRALGLNEDVFHEAPPTIDTIDEEDRSLEHKNAGEPPEPEAIAHQVVKGSRGSRDAHQRFLLEVGAERVAEQAQPLELRLARLRANSRGRHVDISRELHVIEKRIEAAERKLERAA